MLADLLTWLATGGNAFKALGALVLAVSWLGIVRILIGDGPKGWR